MIPAFFRKAWRIASTKSKSAWNLAKPIVIRAISDARVRAMIGAAVSGGFALIGLHVSADMVAGMMLGAAILAGLGPHNPDAQ